MSQFKPAFEFLLPHEGGFTIDSGGPTKFGVSQKSYPSMSTEEIRNLTIAEAESIYRRDFWEPNRYGALDSQPLSSKIFDLAVNMGPGTANKLLQGAIKLCGLTVACDGVIGPQTLEAANKAPEPMLMRNLVALAVARYRQLADDNEHLQQYLAGWIKRASAVPLAEPVADVLGGVD